MSETTYAGWPLIEIYGVGPDGKTCMCAKGAKCTSAGKHPRGDDWESAPRVDVTSMRRRANLGVRTGAPAGFFVLDVDEAGLPAMKALLAEHGPFPVTRRHRTGSGTYHLFFQMPDFPVTNRRGTLPKGIDIRGTGGQVVLPPSVSGKGPYTVTKDAEIAPAPQWLLDAIRPVETEDDEPAPAPTSGDWTDEIPMSTPAAPAPAPERTERQRVYEQSIIDGEIERLRAMCRAATPDGTGYDGEPWDETVFRVACQFLELANAPWSALTVAEARQTLLAEAPRDDGFTTADVIEKFASAQRSVGGKARPEPERSSSATSWADDLPSSPAATPSQRQAPAPTSDPSDFFDKQGLMAIALGQAIVDCAPIRWGQNNRWWTWDESGVWVEDKEAVTNRTIDLLGNRFRTAHASNSEAVVRRFTDVLEIDTPDASVINFRNGMLDWRRGILGEHDPASGSTVQIPHDYDPDATCPRFDAFLDSVMSPDYQRLVWEMIGYLLYSGNPLQVAFLLHGSGGNGKGTLIKVITAMLGSANLAHQSLDALNGNKFAPAHLFGKIANIAGDIDATFQESTATFKMLTGEDRYSGEYKYGDSFSFNNYAVPLFSANKIPGSADVSKGYLRRWVNIEFDRQFTGEPVRGLGESLAATEIPGVIAKGLRHLGELLAAGTFTVKGEAEKGREDFARTLDQVRQWFDDECMPDPDGHLVKREELYRDYRFWAERNGNHKLKAAEFYARLENMGIEPRKVKGTRFFAGVRMMLSHGDDYRGAEDKVTDADFARGA